MEGLHPIAHEMGILSVVSLDRNHHGDWCVIGGAQHHYCAALRQLDDQIGGPGYAVAMDDDGGDIV
ncbi:hypothetical protein ACIGGE_13080 [Qipengyuania sp. NPDC077410]|uniref:hypothetical protein n=1 Tax=Qipengyuania sp. NPDC077410 TaxID=3364496 RepID=UPI0037C95289